jgi:hypothetical protein
MCRFWTRIGRARQPGWPGWPCAAHAAAASLAECCDLCEWFGVSRTRATIHHWYQSYADHYDQDFTADPDRIAVDEKQIQLAFVYPQNDFGTLS